MCSETASWAQEAFQEGEIDMGVMDAIDRGVELSMQAYRAGARGTRESNLVTSMVFLGGTQHELLARDAIY